MDATPNRGGESALAQAFVQLADSLVNDYDPIELLGRLTTVCQQLLPVQAAGVLLADQWDRMRTVASSSEQMRLLELFQLQTDQGPCVDCYRSSEQVSAVDLGDEGETRWPAFARRASEAGFRAVHALPLRLRHETIGALNLLGTQPQLLSPDEVAIGQALADVATIAILQERSVRSQDVPVEQRLVILNQRVLIEQATGVLAEQAHLDMPEAFAELRRYAGETGQRLTDLADALVPGRPHPACGRHITAGHLGAHRGRPRPRPSEVTGDAF